MSHRPWARAASSGTTRFKELLLLSSGLNFLHMPSCHRIRRGRVCFVQPGEFTSAGAGWHRAGLGCCGGSSSVSRWYWWPGWVFLEGD